MSFPQAKTGRIREFLSCNRAWLCALLGVANLAHAAATNSPCAHAEAEFVAAQAANAAARTNVALACQLGRTAFLWADCATNDQRRAQIANEGIRACRDAVARDPQSAAAHYYLAQNLGELARTKSLGALKLVREMEKTWLRAVALDERLDFAGPDRSLGMLYLDAPGWPTSVGSNAKARAHLERAVQLAPDYPDNRLTLAEALLRWHKRDELAAQIGALDELRSRAKVTFAGPDWEAAWLDWEARLAELKRKAK